MKLTIPIYVQAGKAAPDRKEKEFTVRPLFFAEPQRQHEKLERVMHVLAQDLRVALTKLGGQERHDELARWTFSPVLETHRLDLSIELRKRISRPRLFFVAFEALDRRLAMTPAVPDVWFELGRGESLRDRATEVLTAHFRAKERDEEEHFVDPETLSLPGSAWVTPLELEIQPSLVAVPERRSDLAFLGDEGQVEGWQELRRVGRCLDELYPDDLDRVRLRDAEVAELTRLLQGKERRPVLLLGPSLVGKSAILHEFVWRTAHAWRQHPHRSHNQVWLLSPQRLISGMMYVGQWESRLLAILAEAKKRDHVLYFDDLLGMYYAGKSSQSQLSVANVLKPYIERREVRLLGEMTPEAFRVLRERDRGFADLFQVLPVREPTDDQTLRILIAVTRQLEAQHRVKFHLDALPTALDLVRRYQRHQAFPGKGAMFLRRLAVKHRGGHVLRFTTLQEFHEQSGLSMSLLDGQQKLDRNEVLDELSWDVVGQRAATEALADVLSIAKARLNDPERPLGALLFLGPTGVGKTQCARAIARYLFGDADKLLRFDMNEYAEAGAAARLAGTFDQPEGLLTAAVRRQPFAVVLLDEIEKANPEVFDLLLAVLGEGRLTDALGRTVDFTSTLIILTSNLGVREASQNLGFRASAHNAEAYTLAAQRFFRPEFFNRLDRIVPFDRLGREEVGRIARMLLGDLLQREGLVRRKCVLRVEEQALSRIIDAGFDPVLGARALKRTVEQQLVAPVAKRLAAGVPQSVTVISVYPRNEGVAIDVQGLEEVSPLPADHRALGPTEVVLSGVGRVLRNIEDRFSHLRPQGELSAASIAGEHLFYFVMQEQIRALRARQRELTDVLEQTRRSQRGPAIQPAPPSLGKARTWHWNYTHGPLLREMAAAADLRLFLEELAQKASRFSEGERQQVVGLVEDVAMLQVLAEAGDRPGGEQVLVYVWTPSVAGTRHVNELATLYEQGGFVRWLGESAWWQLEQTSLDMTGQVGRALLVRGLAADRLASGERGTHLFCPEHEGLVPVQVHVWPVPEDVDPRKFLEMKRQARRDWLEAGQTGPDPLALEPVVRVYNVNRQWLDVRTRLTDEGMPNVPELVLASLPLPTELQEA